jgi:hypothetical protein
MIKLVDGVSHKRKSCFLSKMNQRRITALRSISVEALKFAKTSQQRFVISEPGCLCAQQREGGFFQSHDEPRA